MMRLFVAIWVPGEVLQALPMEPLREKLTRQGVRFTKPERIHLTLRFLGNVLDESLEPLTQALAERLAGVNAPLLSVDGLGAFPSPQRPGVIWAGVQGELAPVHERVVEGTDDFAEQRDDKRFHPHLTLARVSPPSQKVGRAFDPLLQSLGDQVFGTWTASEVVLVQTLADGSYEIRATFPLSVAAE